MKSAKFCGAELPPNLACILMHLVGSLIKLNPICEVLMHTRFFEEFYKIVENFPGNLQKRKKVQAVPTRNHCYENY